MIFIRQKLRGANCWGMPGGLNLIQKFQIPFFLLKIFLCGEKCKGMRRNDSFFLPLYRIYLNKDLADAFTRLYDKQIE